MICQVPGQSQDQKPRRVWLEFTVQQVMRRMYFRSGVRCQGICQEYHHRKSTFISISALSRSAAHSPRGVSSPSQGISRCTILDLPSLCRRPVRRCYIKSLQPPQIDTCLRRPSFKTADSLAFLPLHFSSFRHHLDLLLQGFAYLKGFLGFSIDVYCRFCECILRQASCSNPTT